MRGLEIIYTRDARSYRAGSGSTRQVLVQCLFYAALGYEVFGDEFEEAGIVPAGRIDAAPTNEIEFVSRLVDAGEVAFPARGILARSTGADQQCMRGPNGAPGSESDCPGLFKQPAIRCRNECPDDGPMDSRSDCLAARVRR